MNPSSEAVLAGLSARRLAPYLQRADGNLQRALGHYCWNLRLCEAFYPLLHLNEVVFRNALHQALIAEFQTEHWFRGGWLNPREQKTVEKTLAALGKRMSEPTPDNIVAELHFGFWCSLCDKRYEHHQTLWPKLFLHTPLRQIPRRQRHRKGLSSAVNRLRQLRNRVFHHEPIWHWQDLAQRHQDSLALLTWINPDAAMLARSLDRFPDIHQQGWVPLQELAK